MPDKKEVLNSMDLALVRRVALHYKDGVFEFELNGDEYRRRHSLSCHSLVRGRGRRKRGG